MTAQVRLRSATAADVDAVLALWRAADAEPSHTDDAAGVLALLAHDPDALVVAEDDDGALVGTVIAGWDGWRGSVYRLVVAPAHRRRGLAAALVREAESRLAARGARRLAAIVVETDEQAVGFWDASGWTRQDARLRYVRSL